jgi:hypothetical protein
MTQITVGPDLLNKLQGQAEAVELSDPSGRVLEYFLSTVNMSEWEPVTPEASEEELREREQSKEWYTTEEVLAHLKSLEQQ